MKNLLVNNHAYPSSLPLVREVLHCNPHSRKQTTSIPIIFLGFPEHQAGFMVLDLKTKKLRIVRDIQVDEMQVIHQFKKRINQKSSPYSAFPQSPSQLKSSPPADTYVDVEDNLSIHSTSEAPVNADTPT